MIPVSILFIFDTGLTLNTNHRRICHVFGSKPRVILAFESPALVRPWMRRIQIPVSFGVYVGLWLCCPNMNSLYGVF